MAALTVQFSRMSKDQALEALRLVRTQLVTHRGLCQHCAEARSAKARRTTAWSLWTTCEAYRELLRTQLAVNHRLFYLKQSAVKKAAQAAGMTAWQWQRERPREYARLVAQYELAEEGK